MLRSGNPTLKAFERPQTIADFERAERAVKSMTIQGTVNATMILVGLCAAAAIGSWMLITGGSSPSVAMPLLFGGMLGGGLFGLILTFAPRTAPFLSPVYALCEGAFLGALSYVVAGRIGGASGPATGIIFQAILLTFGIAGSLMLGYTSGLIRVGSTMQRCVVAALGGVLFIYIAGMVMRYCGFSVPFMHELFGFGKTGLIGIGFSAFMLLLGSFFLVMDFQMIEEHAQSGAPKYMEWYGGFSLLATLIWLYVEALRLLSKLRSND